MSDCVDREAVVGILKKLGLGKDIDYADEMYLAALSDVARHIKSLSSVEPERAKGHWIDAQHWFSSYSAECSVCKKRARQYAEDSGHGGYIYSFMDFCPNCGADMREEKE